MTRLQELKDLTNLFLDKLEKNGFSELNAACDLIKNAGITANIHVGKGQEMKENENNEYGKIMIIECWLGGFLNIRDNYALFAVNYWLNYKKQFCDDL